MSINPAHFFQKHLDLDVMAACVPGFLKQMDFGELYCSYGSAESVTLKSGLIESAAASTGQGFGLRGVTGELVHYAHSNVLAEKDIRAAATFINDACRGVKNSHLVLTHGPSTGTPPMYAAINPGAAVTMDARMTLLQEIDGYARALSPMVNEVMAAVSSSYEVVAIIDERGQVHYDVRPMVSLRVMIMVKSGDKQESGMMSMGGRRGLTEYMAPAVWQSIVDTAYKQAVTMLSAKPAPGGTMPIVMGNGWNGILFHEAVGHGLEADANFEKSSVFHDKMNKRVATDKVTLMDSGLKPDRRGSLTIDDEGTPTQETTLIKDGMLVSYLYDRRMGALMDKPSTGSGRRESYAYAPIPRMRNTYLAPGTDTVADMIASIDHGIYVAQVSGGQVDTAKGTFVFEVSEAYEIKNGQKGQAIKGATLIGEGLAVLQKISMVGSDDALDPGMGTCGKQGQGVPVGVGQPSLKVDAITVGGTG